MKVAWVGWLIRVEANGAFSPLFCTLSNESEQVRKVKVQEKDKSMQGSQVVSENECPPGSICVCVSLSH